MNKTRKKGGTFAMAGALGTLAGRKWQPTEADHGMVAQQASGGEGGGFSAKDYVDVKVDGVRSELQASIADLRAEVRGLSAKIDALPTTWTMVGTIAGGFTVSLGLIFAFLSYSNDNAEHVRARQKQLDEAVALSAQTDRKLTDVVTGLERTAALAEENSQKISALSERLDGLAERMEQFVDVLEQDARRKK